MRAACLLAALLAVAGCHRNTPGLQADDFRTCKAAGMGAALNIYGEVMCVPPSETCQ